MTKCFYHSADLDGKCSAAIVKKHIPEAEMCPIDYGQCFPWCEIKPDMTVYMVDFSLPIEEMLRLEETVGLGNLIWIDHHKTAMEAAARAKFHPKGSIFRLRLYDGNMAACEISWKYFNGGVGSLPLGIKLLGRYDVWDHSNPLTLPYQYGMRAAGEWHPENRAWDLVFESDPSFLADTLKRGQGVLRYEQSQNAIRAKSLCFDAMLGDLFVIAANQGLTNSQLFDSVWDPKKYQAMVTFYFCDREWHGPCCSKWKFSIYSTRDDIDVSKVAQEFGGGGHKGAAGFTFEGNPFDVLKPVPF